MREVFKSLKSPKSMLERVVGHRSFDNAVIVLIIFSGVLLSLDDPLCEGQTVDGHPCNNHFYSCQVTNHATYPRRPLADIAPTFYPVTCHVEVCP